MKNGMVKIGMFLLLIMVLGCTKEDTYTQTQIQTTLLIQVTDESGIPVQDAQVKLYGSENDMFHFNWGWAGAYNNYFVVSALNPQGTGTGGGSGTYNSNQKIVIGIQPPATSQQDYIALYNYLTPSASTINYGQSFSVSTNIPIFTLEN